MSRTRGGYVPNVIELTEMKFQSVDMKLFLFSSKLYVPWLALDYGTCKEPETLDNWKKKTIDAIYVRIIFVSEGWDDIMHKNRELRLYSISKR